MKKIFLSLLVTTLTLFAVETANADSFQELIQQNKPCALLITADWADNLAEVQSAFATMQNSYSNKYNFKELNIASPETKEFNKTNYIYTNLPYIVLYKNKGLVSRWINRDCILNSSCISEKFDLFAN